MLKRGTSHSLTYACEMQGPPHSRLFKASVTIDGNIYIGPEFCSTLKDAEHAAAKVALLSLSPDGAQEDDCLYKSLLQELAQKRGLPLPLYTTSRSGQPHVPSFGSTVQIAGECYVGQEARTKKQAEMNAAKVAYNAFIEGNESFNVNQISLRVTEDDPELFGDDSAPRPKGQERHSKSQRSSNSSATSGSNPTMFQEMLQQRYTLDRVGKIGTRDVGESWINKRLKKEQGVEDRSTLRPKKGRGDEGLANNYEGYGSRRRGGGDTYLLPRKKEKPRKSVVEEDVKAIQKKENVVVSVKSVMKQVEQLQLAGDGKDKINVGKSTLEKTINAVCKASRNT